MKTPDLHQGRHSCVFIAKFEHILHIVGAPSTLESQWVKRAQYVN